MDENACTHENAYEVLPLEYRTSKYDTTVRREKITYHQVWVCLDCGRITDGDSQPMTGEQLEAHVKKLFDAMRDRLDEIEQQAKELRDILEKKTLEL